MAQFTIKLPKIKKEQPKTEQTPNPAEKTKHRPSSSQLMYSHLPRLQSIPRLLHRSLEINVRTESRYWKFPKQDNYSSWIPTVKFNVFFDNSVNLRYNAEWTNADGTPSFTEPLRFGSGGADQTVRISSDFSQDFDKTSTVTTGTYGLKMMIQRTMRSFFRANSR